MITPGCECGGFLQEDTSESALKAASAHDPSVPLSPHILVDDCDLRLSQQLRKASSASIISAGSIILSCSPGASDYGSCSYVPLVLINCSVPSTHFIRTETVLVSLSDHHVCPAEGIDQR